MYEDSHYLMVLMILNVDFKEYLIFFWEKKTHIFGDRVFISFFTSSFLAELTTLKTNAYVPVVMLYAVFVHINLLGPIHCSPLKFLPLAFSKPSTLGSHCPHFTLF